MTIYAAPGATIEASALLAETGLVGTVRIRILDTPSGAAFLAPTTVGIVENPAASKLYTWTGVGPATAGTLSIIWDRGSDATTLAAEELVVTSTAPITTAGGAGDLTTLAAVKSFLRKTDAGEDGILQTLITNASRAIHSHTGRELADMGTLTRRFRVSGRNVSLAPFDLRAATLVKLNPELGAGATTLAADSDYALAPINGANITGTYLDVSLSNLLALPGISDYGYASSSDYSFRFGSALVDITGTWGPAVTPADVNMACVVTVATWYRRDVANFSTTYSLDEGRVERPAALPSAVVGMLAPYARMDV